VGGRQEVGHIDLLDTISYFEVPEKDARKVMTQLTGIRFKGRQVRCNDADDDTKPAQRQPQRSAKKSDNQGKPARSREFSGKKDDWRALMKSVELKGEKPDFSEEGWARRRPKKK
jgi:ATP-dependent RNA helicase DeaD